MKKYDVIVVGGGVASICFIREYIRSSPKPSSILWVRASGGCGVAYDTPFHSHLLNVPVKKLGVDENDPEDFYRWLKVSSSSDNSEPSQFVSRFLYGEYLKDLASTLGRSGIVDVRHSFATGCEWLVKSDSFWKISLANGERFRAAKLIIAIGTGFTSDSDERSQYFIGDPWRWLLSDHRRDFELDMLRLVTIIGSGLTAMDMVIALRDLGYCGDIDVISLSGRWAEPHQASVSIDGFKGKEVFEILKRVPTAKNYLATMRKLSKNYPWRTIVDALRAFTPALWNELSVKEQRRFMRHLFDVWNRHRHRAPPETMSRILLDKKVRLMKGRADTSILNCGGFAEKSEHLIIDCRGLRLGSRHSRPSLVRKLLSQGFLEEHENGMGVKSADKKRLEIFGALRFGYDFECTAVPELRSHAQATAKLWTNVA